MPNTSLNFAVQQSPQWVAGEVQTTVVDTGCAGVGVDSAWIYPGRAARLHRQRIRLNGTLIVGLWVSRAFLSIAAAPGRVLRNALSGRLLRELFRRSRPFLL